MLYGFFFSNKDNVLFVPYEKQQQQNKKKKTKQNKK